MVQIAASRLSAENISIQSEHVQTEITTPLHGVGPGKVFKCVIRQWALRRHRPREDPG
jgi:hypothetical protein